MTNTFFENCQFNFTLLRTFQDGAIFIHSNTSAPLASPLFSLKLKFPCSQLLFPENDRKSLSGSPFFPEYGKSSLDLHTWECLLFTRISFKGRIPYHAPVVCVTYSKVLSLSYLVCGTFIIEMNCSADDFSAWSMVVLVLFAQDLRLFDFTGYCRNKRLLSSMK